MFIKFKDIEGYRLIDVRTPQEFSGTRVFPINIPIIHSEQYAKIKKFYPCAFFIITYGLIKDRKRIKRALLKESNNGLYPLVFTCSRGRLRSPLMWCYAKILGIDAKVLLGGVKGEIKRRFK